MKPKLPTPDLWTRRIGSMVMLRSTSARAEAWLKDCCEVEPWQRGAQCVSVDVRFAGDIVAAAVSAGLMVRDQKTGNLAHLEEVPK